MAQADKFWLADTITCHAWNSDRTKLALCPNNTEIHIYSKQGNEWKREIVLNEHDKVVTGIDWAPNTNRIVSCGQDRNAYVWEKQKTGEWKPTLVILRINRAATHVRWSPNEDKFAVASGSKCVSICYFEVDNDWWVSKHIKKHKSTVLDISWHPGNILLATASSDFNCRVFSTFIKGIDKKPSATPFGTKLPFGSLQGEYQSAGWVQSVDWDADGNQIAFVGHDSTITFIDVNGGAPGEVQVVRSKELPFQDLKFVAADKLVAAGHNFCPILFSKGANGWEQTKNLDQKTAAVKKKATGTKAAFSMFQNRVNTGQNVAVKKLQTRHNNAINCIRGVDGTPGNYTRISTTGLDGKLCFWAV